MLSSIKIIQPLTTDEFEKYFNLRWEILRKPWHQPKGSECDELEEAAVHFMAVDDRQKLIGVCRLHFVDETTGQIRYMAVLPDLQHKGIGRILLSDAENVARKKGIKLLILQARENVVGFYERQGYQVKEKTFLLYDEIQHFLMKKVLV